VRRTLRRIGLLSILLLAPELAFASEESGGGSHFFWEWANLVLLVVVLVFVARKPVLAYLADRRSDIEGNIEGAEKLFSDAKTRLAEWNARADQLDNEVAEIKRSAKAAAEQERDRLIADARETAERIKGNAQSAVAREVRRAREELRSEATSLAVELAENLLREQVSDADQARLVDEFVTRVESGGTH